MKQRSTIEYSNIGSGEKPKESHEIAEVNYTTDCPPDIEEVLIQAICATGEETNEPFRRALQAESRGEMNPELEKVIDTIIGIKLYGIEQGNPEIISSAEAIFLDFVAGDEVATHIVERGASVLESHNPLSARISLNYEDEVQNISHQAEKLSFTPEKKQQWISDQLEGYEKRMGQGSERVSYAILSAVHATDVEPRRHRDGRLHIETSVPRSTVHVALNHLVEGSPFSADWSGRRIIVVAPMDETVEINGAPSSHIAHDTWWEVIPGKGLVLPEGTVIIKPGATRPIQAMEGGKEIRYKDQAITLDDVGELVEDATDYELSCVAAYLGIALGSEDLHYVDRSSSSMDSLQSQEAKLDKGVRNRIISELTKTVGRRDSQATQPVIYLAKLIAVRIALEQQGREHMEPITTMSGGQFRYEPLNSEFALFRNHRSHSGHHSSSIARRLESSILRLKEKDEDGEPTEKTRSQLIKYIRENCRLIGIGNLHMCYRLGLL